MVVLFVISTQVTIPKSAAFSTTIARLGPGDISGSLSVTMPATTAATSSAMTEDLLPPCAATVVCTLPSYVVEVGRHIAQALHSLTSGDTDARVKYLLHTLRFPFFADMAVERLHQLASVMKKQHFAANSIVVREGTQTLLVGFVASGSCKMVKRVLMPPGWRTTAAFAGNAAGYNPLADPLSDPVTDPLHCDEGPLTARPSDLGTWPHWSGIRWTLVVNLCVT